MGLLSGIGNVLGSVSGLVGSTLNSLTGVKDTAKQSMSDQIKLWNMQNAYNTPSAQIARMADAGIDINPMTYAVGNGNMSTTAGSIGSPNYSGSGINPIATAMNVAEGIKDMQVKNKNMASTERDMKNKALEYQIMEHNLGVARKLGMPVGQTPVLYGQGQGIKEVADTIGRDVVNRSVGIGEKFGNWLQENLPHSTPKSLRTYKKDLQKAKGNKFYWLYKENP